MSYLLGCGFAPLIGGFLYDKVGLRKTCSIMAFAGLGLFVFYFFVGFVFNKDKKRKENTENHD